MSKEVSRECRFVVHVPSKDRNISDVHLIKEQIHYEDGTIKPNVRIMRDYKRPIWVTRERFRNHEQKKEWEDVDKLYTKRVSQSTMIFDVARMLNMGYVKNPRNILGNPYVYGADVHSTTFIKSSYGKKYPNGASSPYTIATLDIETNVLDGSEDILMCTIAFNNQVYTVIDKSFLKGIANPTDQLHRTSNKYLKEYIENKNLNITYEIAESPLDVIMLSFKKLHEWRPDFLAIWNINYDIPMIIKQIKKSNVDPKDILCDPNVPKEYRSCYYAEGPNKKITASGVLKPLALPLQWHTLYLTASFYVIDAMCVYKRVRLASPDLPSYSLDNILNLELGKRKLRFEETDQYTGLEWHEVMQQQYKLEYVVYNIYDSYGMLELEDKTKDLSFSLPSLVGNSPFNKTSSPPSLIADDFFFFLYDNEKKVLGCTGNSPEISTTLPGYSGEDEEEENFLPLSLKGWIATIPSHLITQGLNLIDEDDSIYTNIRCFVSDLDASSAYPTALTVANISKSTTVRELSSITGIDEGVFRMQNMNLLGGEVNSIEYVTTMLDGVDLLDIEDVLNSN